MARNSEMVGSSGNIVDLTKDQIALQKMKELEKKLKKKLVTITEPDGTVISATKGLLKQLSENN